LPDDPTAPEKQPKHWPRSTAQWLITLSAVSLLVFHYIRPTATIDHITVALLLVAVLPWLGLVFKSIELPGLGKFEYLERELREQRAALKSNENVTNVTSEMLLNLSGSALPNDSGAEDLQRLAQEYVAVRAARPRGWERTAEVTRIFAKMTAAASRTNNFDVRSALNSVDPGQRLAAISFLYAKPDASMLSELVDTIVDPSKEDKGFNQYWGIKAIGKALALQTKPNQAVLEKLAKFAARVEEGTDRKYELTRLLSEFRGRGRSEKRYRSDQES
jgi:hypothetical protein